jgi:putative transcriptional regulator
MMNLPGESHEHQDLAGQLLFACPTMQGGPFEHSVVLLSNHSASDGAFGVILNQPTGQTVGDVLSDQMFRPLRHISVHRGGPVSPSQLFFAAMWWEPPHGLRIIHQISAEDAIIHHQQPGALVRAFVGYSGWSPGQLEEEIERHTWIVSPAPETLLGYHHDESLWATTLRSLSPYHRILADAPKNPFAN